MAAADLERDRQLVPNAPRVQDSPGGPGGLCSVLPLAPTCVTVASALHPLPDTTGHPWTDLDTMRGSCGGDAGIRTRTGRSPSDFKSDAVVASRACEGRFCPLLQASCVQFAWGWHPRLWGAPVRRTPVNSIGSWDTKRLRGSAMRKTPAGAARPPSSAAGEPWRLSRGSSQRSTQRCDPDARASGRPARPACRT